MAGSRPGSPRNHTRIASALSVWKNNKQTKPNRQDTKHEQGK